MTAQSSANDLWPTVLQIKEHNALQQSFKQAICFTSAGAEGSSWNV